uniref:NADH:ubiquinone reductase (H(+)-translocating) n=2 Tax=unclassified Ceraphron TaxID=2625706 RepID=A0A096XKU2_9HYME|nr:NADH dehydrogenase subunit 5 [Ceraphron sp. MM-2014]
MKVYLFIFYMGMLCMLLMFYALIFLLNKILFFMSWTFYSILGVNISMIIYFDWMSMLFFSIVLFITSFVMFYSLEYLGGVKFINLYMYLVLLFVLSMGLVIYSPNLLSILLGWDGLGLISYCLVSFYQNFFSYKSAMLTLLMNRIGDLTLILSLCFMWSKESWFFMFFEDGGFVIISFLLMVSGFAKSAQIPLSIWLPAAMAAPTPISALVHSSTLVTAGVYLFLRFSMIYLLSFSYFLLNMLTLFTIFMASMVALFIYDLKKIIAMSTLSQLGLMMFFYSFGILDIVFFHLLIHALFKSMMFMCAGILIHYLGDIQDIRLMGGSGSNNLMFTMNSLVISSLALSGLPFLSGFYSKDFLIELMLMMNSNWFLYSGSIFLLMLTVMYSLRIMFFLLNLGNFKVFMFKESESMIMSLSLLMLSVSSVFSGIIFLNLLFMSEMIFLGYLDLCKPLLMLFMSVFICYYFFNLDISINMNLFKFISLMWGMNLIISYINGVIYKFMLKFLVELDKGWSEEFLLGILKKLIKLSFNLLNIYFNYIYMIVIIWSLFIMI